ncbi:hypothetical protein GCM10010433_26990 [Streptomyces pulveraceus]
MRARRLAERLAQGAPTMLSSLQFAHEMPFSGPESWLNAWEPSWERLAARAGELLADGPLFLVPIWERKANSVRRQATDFDSYHAEVMASCRRPTPDAVMALLLPALAWTSDRPRDAKMRTKVAEHWGTLLVVYASGALTQLRTSLESVVVFLRARARARARAQTRPVLKVFRCHALTR